MSIRTKLYGTICIVILNIILFVYSAITLVINKKFDQLEREMVFDDLKKMETVFNLQIEDVGSLVKDWKDLNGTCLLTTCKSEGHGLEKNITESFLKSAKIEMLLILKPDGSLGYDMFFDNTTEQFGSIDDELVKAITMHQRLFSDVSQKKNILGIIQAGSKHMIIAASQIDGGKGEDSSRGILILGRLLDTKWLEEFNKTTSSSLSIKPIFGNQSEEVEASPLLSPSSSPYHIEVLTDDMIKGYVFVNDVFGTAVMELSICLGREMHKQSHKTNSFLLQAIIFCSIVSWLALYFFIDIIILRRLTAIISDITDIEKNGIHGSRVRESLVRDELGQLSKSLNHMLDANESLEEYKVKSKKLEALTSFAAGATHELATPLSAIAVASGEILHDLAIDSLNEDELLEDIFLIREQVDRCKYILNQMAADAGQHMGEEIVPFSIRDLIASTVVLFNESTVKRIEVENQIADLKIAMPFQSLCRVLRGIIKNGIYASENDKTIYLSCYQNTSFIFFKVRDQGTGMSEDTLNKAVEPFFSTKPPGENLGLGLYLAQSLATRFGGGLDLLSSPGCGTTVTISFAKEQIYVESQHNSCH